MPSRNVAMSCCHNIGAFLCPCRVSSRFQSCFWRCGKPISVDVGIEECRVYVSWYRVVLVVMVMFPFVGIDVETSRSEREFEASVRTSQLSFIEVFQNQFGTLPSFTSLQSSSTVRVFIDSDIFSMLVCLRCVHCFQKIRFFNLRQPIMFPQIHICLLHVRVDAFHRSSTCQVRFSMLTIVFSCRLRSAG